MAVVNLQWQFRTFKLGRWSVVMVDVVACRYHHVTWQRVVPRSKPKSGPELGLRALKKRSPSRRPSKPFPTASLRFASSTQGIVILGFQPVQGPSTEDGLTCFYLSSRHRYDGHHTSRSNSGIRCKTLAPASDCVLAGVCRRCIIAAHFLPLF